MKRIAVFCDGTWNRVSAKHPTNVRIGAQFLEPRGEDGVSQLNFYTEGVGTTYIVNEWLETRLAGAFGYGLFDKIAEAYRFLVFNYEPGDEIFIFGFSRGAFTARSLAGLIRKCGIISTARVGEIRAAFDFYKLRDPNDPDRTHPDRDEAQTFRLKYAPETVLKDIDREWRIAQGEPAEKVNSLPKLTIKYIGVWDTVGALGIPRHLLVSRLFRTHEKYAFYDYALSSTVHAARHAVAVDEERLSYKASIWDNIERLNQGLASPRYEQKWFPGDHGSVGGGGDITDLSNDALDWIVRGAVEQGLAFDLEALAEAFGRTDPLAPLHNSTEPVGFVDQIYRRGARTGPSKEDELAEATLSRLEYEGKADSFVSYRPKTLEKIHKNQKHFQRSGGAGW